MLQPDALKTNEHLEWSPGRGVDVWEMLHASAAGDLERVRSLLAMDPALLRCQFEYRTPLNFAVRGNHLRLVEFLFEQGTKPEPGVGGTPLDLAQERDYTDMAALIESTLVDGYGVSPRGDLVPAAIRAHDLTMVSELLDASPELLRAADLHGNQPIHWAAMARQLDIIDELLKRGADIDAQRIDGARPLQLFNGDYHYRGWRDVPKTVTTTPQDVLTHLLARGAHCDICTASHMGEIDRVRELLNVDPSLANKTSDYVSYYLGGGTPLRNAAAKGHIEIVRLLLHYGADPNLREEGIAPQGAALYSAVCGNHYDVASLLLEHGAFPNPVMESSADALTMAHDRADAKMVELLCRHGAARRMHILAYYGDLETAAAMLSVNRDLANDPEALAYAAEEGQDAFVRLLLRYRSDLATRIGIAGKTRGITELLFQHGMNPGHENWLHLTPLHRFAGRGDVENARLFLDHGANINARDEDLCSTPLGWAARAGHLPMVELLLSRGAVTNLADDPAWATPLAWAIKKGHAEVEAAVRKAGAAA